MTRAIARQERARDSNDPATCGAARMHVAFRFQHAYDDVKTHGLEYTPYYRTILSPRNTHRKADIHCGGHSNLATRQSFG